MIPTSRPDQNNLNLCSDAQRRGNQGNTDEIEPEQTPRHVRWHHPQRDTAGEMFRSKGRQRDCEAQVGQGYHLVDAMNVGDVVFGGQQTNREQREAGGGHRKRGAGGFKQ